MHKKKIAMIHNMINLSDGSVGWTFFSKKNA